MNPLLTYLRWRHSKGFGVHSPYAYRFVTEVVRPGSYGYYSYWEIDENLRGTEKLSGDLNPRCSIRFIRFLIRTFVFLKAKRIIYRGEGGEKSEERTVEVAARCLKIPVIKKWSRDKENFSEGDVLVTEGSAGTENLVNKALDSSIAVLALRPDGKVRALMRKPLERGLLLEDKALMILIPRSEMAYVAYDISLLPHL